MQAIPMPPAPQLGAMTAYGLAIGTVLIGLAITFFGCRLHYALAAAVGVGAGFVLAPVVQGHVDINPTFVQVAVVLVTAVVLAVAARVTWALAAGAVGAAAGATVLLVSQAAMIPEAASESLTAWWQSVAPAVFDMGTIERMWDQQQGLVLLVMFPATVLPLLLGLFFNRVVVVLVTALIGAVVTVAGLVVGLAQIKARLWPQSWMDVGVLGIAVVVMALIGAICQCLFVQRRKAEDQDKAQAEQQEKA